MRDDLLMPYADSMAGTNKGRQGYYRSSNSGVGLGLELS
jgi:hypothetical protein